MNDVEFVAALAEQTRSALAEQRGQFEGLIKSLKLHVDSLETMLRAIPAGRDGVDGKDADQAAIVQEVLAQMPAPVNGRDGTNGVDGRDAVVDTDAIAKAVLAQVPTPKDGTDGKDGAPGKDADPVDTVALARDVLSLIPVPRDGKDGIASLDEIKAIASKAVDDRLEDVVQKRVSEAVGALPVLRYRGVFKEGEEYRAGECVTWAGSVWNAQATTKEKPGEGKTAWVLMVKKGRDAR